MSFITRFISHFLLPPQRVNVWNKVSYSCMSTVLAWLALPGFFVRLNIRMMPGIFGGKVSRFHACFDLKLTTYPPLINASGTYSVQCV